MDLSGYGYPLTNDLLKHLYLKLKCQPTKRKVFVYMQLSTTRPYCLLSSFRHSLISNVLTAWVRRFINNCHGPETDRSISLYLIFKELVVTVDIDHSA